MAAVPDSAAVLGTRMCTAVVDKGLIFLVKCCTPTLPVY